MRGLMTGPAVSPGGWTSAVSLLIGWQSFLRHLCIPNLPPHLGQERVLPQLLNSVLSS